MEWYFPNDGSEADLNERDARLVSHILCTLPAPPRVLEIGVWKGAFVSVCLMNVPACTAVGVDPFPGDYAESRQVLSERIARLGLQERFKLVADVEDIPEGDLAPFDLIHIDGEHSEAAVWRDLAFSYSAMSTTGVLVVDDINNYWHPGVASAMYRFCERTDLRLFMTSGLKGYLARAETARVLADKLRLEVDGLPGLTSVWTKYGEPPEVLGQAVLKVRDLVNSSQ